QPQVEGRADQARIVKSSGGSEVRLHLKRDNNETRIFCPIVPFGHERRQYLNDFTLAKFLLDDQWALVAQAGNELYGLSAAWYPARGDLAKALDLHAANERIRFALKERKNRMVEELQVGLAGVEGLRQREIKPERRRQQTLPVFVQELVVIARVY